MMPLTFEPAYVEGADHDTVPMQEMVQKMGIGNI